MSSVKSQKLSTLDHIFSILSDKKTLLDFAFVLHFPGSPNINALEAGAQSATSKFPISNSFLYRQRWEHIHTYNNQLDVTSEDLALERFMNTPFGLRVEAPFRQLILLKPDAHVLVTRFHHAAADGLSAAMWLSHQIQVARGETQPVKTPGRSNVPILKVMSPSVWRSKFSYSAPSSPLRTCTNTGSNRRNWQSIIFEATGLKEHCRKAGGFSYNDLLAVCALQVLIAWNELHKDSSHVGLWVPINIRQRSNVGFGNGTSRIRIYPRYERQSSFVEKAREIRRQVRWCTANGEWVVPNLSSLQKIPTWLSAPLINTYLASRYVDMGTAVFSHADSLAGGVGEGLQIADRIECIGLLQKRQRLAINGTTHHGQTCLTFTYDSGMFCADAIKQLCELFQRQIESARRELSDAWSL